jgi:hypothetical protein
MRRIILPALAASVVLAVLSAGCVSAGRAKREQAAAYEVGRQQAQQERERQPPSVTFVGDIRQPTVPWIEGMTLAQALLAAQYSALWDPHRITIRRQGQAYAVHVRRFLAGEENPVLLPGDIIEIRR